MDSNRKTAIIVGVLFITATVSALLSFAFAGLLLDDPDYLIKFSTNSNQVSTAAIFSFILAASVIGISVMMFPILRNHNEGLAVGYVGFRIMEAVGITIGAISILTLLTLSQEFVKAGAPDASNFQNLGTLLLATLDWAFLIGPELFFGVSALILYYLLYQSKILPRFIAVWGFIGAALLLAGVLLNIYGIESTDILALPIGVNEMFLAGWLIVRGFNSPEIASESTGTDAN